MGKQVTSPVLCRAALLLALLHLPFISRSASLRPATLPATAPVLTPAFEEQPATSGETRFVWRTSHILATLASGGVVDIRGSSGPCIRISFPGANKRSQPVGEGRSPRKTLVYLGRNGWREDANADIVRYREIYPGIDLLFLTNSGQLEFNFELAAGADPKAIRVRYTGARVSVKLNGDVQIRAPGITLIQHRPRASQKRAGGENSVRCDYLIANRHEVRLRMGEYDTSASLTIDPILSFSTYIGGSGFDAIYGIATDSAGELYIVGETSSASLWNNSMPARTSRDAFVAKLNSTATQVLFTTYLGGAANDSGRAIAVDSAGNVYVTGTSASTDFPVTGGAFLKALSGVQNAFVAKLDATGHLLYSTYLGGGASDFANAIAVDSSGAAYVAGQTGSANFPVTTGAVQTSYGGGLSDCFVSKLNPAGAGLIYSTFLGGSALDLCNAIATDSAGNAYVAGTSYSPDLPLQSALQGLVGTANAFVSKINPAGSTLLYSTFIGGCGLDQGYAIAVDSAGSAYVAGATSSVDFPVTAAAAQSALTGMYNAFVSKLSPGGSSLSYSTLIGGSRSDTASSIAIDSGGRAFLGGYTSSPDFPSVSALQPANRGSFDAFVTVVDPLGMSFLFSTYVGGADDDRAYALTIGPGDEIYLAGATASNNFPISAALQPGLNVAYDAFLLEFSGVSVLGSPSLAITKAHTGNFTRGQNNAAYTVIVSNAANAAPTSGMVTVTETVPAGLTLASMGGTGWTCSVNTCSRFDALYGGASYPAISVNVNVQPNAASPQVNAVAVSGGGSAAANATDTTIISPAPATSFLTGYGLNNPRLRNDYTGWVGMKLVVGASALTVSSAGRLCAAGNGATHTVKFVNASTGADVAGGSVAVNLAGCTTGQFVYTALSPALTLAANTAYYLVSQEASGGDQWYDQGGVSSTSAAAVSAAVYSWYGVWTLAGSQASYVPPNFTYVTSGGGSTITATVGTNTAGASFSVDGVTYSSPQVFQWNAGDWHTFAVVSPQSGGSGTQYVWSSWSDGGGQTHSVSPQSSTVYTANLQTQYQLAASVSPAGAGGIAANPSSSTGYYGSGTSVQLTATANPGETFVNWSGDLSGSTVQQSLTMSAPHAVTANFQSSGGGGGGTQTSFLTGYGLNNPRLRNDYTGWVGMKLVVGASALTVSSAGRLCAAGNGATHTVKFVNASTGADVAGGSVAVNLAGCTAGQFVYAALSPALTLAANTAYYLVSQEASGGDQWYDQGGVSSTSAAAVSAAVYSWYGVWTLAGSQASYVPPNFTYVTSGGGN